MRITKNDRVLVETTNKVNGMLEQGGVCGRVVAYPLDGVLKATGLTRAEIDEADADDQAPEYPEGVTIRQACERELRGRVACKGGVIE